MLLYNTVVDLKNINLPFKPSLYQQMGNSIWSLMFMCVSYTTVCCSLSVMQRSEVFYEALWSSDTSSDVPTHGPGCLYGEYVSMCQPILGIQRHGELELAVHSF